ncbi:MAG: Sec-independent protein translocase protein [Pseudomonadota bacterium]|jgi:sec-independent protein translocase protein TatA
MGAFSLSHILILLVVVVLIFGTKKLKNLGGDLGGAIKGFKDAMEEDKKKDAAQQQLTDGDKDSNVVNSEKVDEKR